MRSHWHRNVLHKGDPQTPQGIHFTGLEAMLSTDPMWRSRLFGGTRTLPSLPERDFLGVSLVIRGFRTRNPARGLGYAGGRISNTLEFASSRTIVGPMATTNIRQPSNRDH